MKILLSLLRTVFILAVAAVLAGVILFGGQLYLAKNTKNADNSMITNLTVSGITATSAKVEYMTKNEAVTTFFYGTNPSNLIYFLPDGSAGSGHRFLLANLIPHTTYYLRIKIGEKLYDNNGMPWGFVTAAQ